MSKFCRGCVSFKAESEFSRSSFNRDGLRTRCKTCENAYAASEAGKAAGRKQRESGKPAENNKRYAATAKGKAAYARDKIKNLNGSRQEGLLTMPPVTANYRMSRHYYASAENRLKNITIT